MYISKATFVVEKAEEAVFSQKIASDLASLTQTEACISNECWTATSKDKISFSLISKWNTKADCQSWLKRPEHLEHHRKMAAEGKANPNLSRPKVEKKIEEFTLYVPKQTEKK